MLTFGCFCSYLMKSSTVQRISTQRRERKWEQDCSCERWIRKSLRGDWLNWRLQGNGRLLSCHSEERIQVDDVSLGREMQSCIATDSSVWQCKGLGLILWSFQQKSACFLWGFGEPAFGALQPKNYYFLCNRKNICLPRIRALQKGWVFFWGWLP